jgi:hypothetical protein
MKKTLLMLYVTMMCTFLNAQSVVTITIGTGTDSQPYPFDMWYGYTRSAAIYTSGEIGASGLISAIGWEVALEDLESSPVKIYLKLTSDASLYETSWSSIISGATLVYNSTVSFPALGWKSFDIADFVYSGSQNLLVLCEANYGGNGAPSNPVFSYSYNPDQHEGWQQHETPPTGTGVIDANRPNLQIAIQRPLSNPQPPSGFIAESVSASQINLNWQKNSSNNNVLVAVNTVNFFGTPSGAYVPGSTISGGGTVLYNGSSTSFTHNSGLNPATTYYYKAWSVLPPTPVYSMGVNTEAATSCLEVNNFPYLTDFETSAFPPVCWSQANKPWMRNGSTSAFGVGTGAAFADFYNILSGSFVDFVSPTLNLTMMANPVVTFDQAYATVSGQVDRLELWASADDGLSYNLVTTWLGGLNGPLNTGGAVLTPFVPANGQWATKSYSIPIGTNKILFRGVSSYGNNLFLDNILVGEPLVAWNGSVSEQWHNPLNWTPNGVPGGTQNVVISSGKPFNPGISTTGNMCNNLIINNNAALSLISGSDLVIFGHLTIHDNASLNNSGTLIIKGNITNFNAD